MKIAVLIPCLNEEATIGGVIADFRRELPDAEIHVYDNGSSDRTAEIARNSGACVTVEQRTGKGNVVRSMFREIQADLFVMVDGDRTYPADTVHALIEPVAQGRADMAVGDRISNRSYRQTNRRAFHNAGNRLVRWLINRLFGASLRDILSGYRAFNPLFVKTMPVLSRGFEIETEMTLHALDKRFRIVEIPVEYGRRPEGSDSKLDTFRDGARVLNTLLWIFKDYKPLLFFGALSLFFSLLGLAAGFLPVLDYLREHYVYHVPLAILAVGLMVFAVLFFAVGLILDTVARFHRLEFEHRLNHYVESRQSKKESN